LTTTDESATLTQWQLFGKPDYGTFYADVTRIATITSSDGSDASALLDDNGATYATVSGEAPYWEINVPVPVKPLGFSIVSGDDGELDPMNIVLYGYDEDDVATQLATKALSFPARGSRLTYTTSSTKLFKRFQLVCTETVSSSVRLAAFELYGVAIAETDAPGFFAPTSVDATAVGLSNTELIGRVNDGSRTTCYRANFTEPVAITFTYDQPISINTYGITASKSEQTRDPANWTLEGSNDGSSWTQLDSRTGETFSQRYATQFYPVETTESYSTYRLTVTATGGANQIQIGEIQLLYLEENPTGICQPQIANNNSSNNKWYDLSGRQITNDKLTKGIYINNGRKILIK
jgi:hypothetical protein